MTTAAYARSFGNRLATAFAARAQEAWRVCSTQEEINLLPPARGSRISEAHVIPDVLSEPESSGWRITPNGAPVADLLEDAVPAGLRNLVLIHLYNVHSPCSTLSEIEVLGIAA